MLGVRDGQYVPSHLVLGGLAGLAVRCGSVLVAVGLC